MFSLFKKKLAVHDSSFHTDDVFACAAILILENDNVKIIRTHDPKIIEKADYVTDIGGVYDENRNRFDHHQPGGAGKRDNGIEYASIGLVWKKFGARLAGSAEAAKKVDQVLIQSIDASDNGINLANYIYPDVFYFHISNLIGSFNATSWENENDTDERFHKAVILAKEILKRQIKIANDRIEIEKNIRRAYEEAIDKRIVVINRPTRRIELMEALQKMPEPLFVVYPNGDGRWRATGIPAELKSFSVRKNFPANWAGLRDEELAKISGVSDALFCHRSLFTTSTKSKEGAMKLAEIALKS